MNYKIALISAVAALLLLSGCESKEGYSDLEENIAGYAVFDPTTGSIPYPNNILFAPNSSSTNDFDGAKTLNIPYEANDKDAPIKKQLNALTGFSTTSPIIAPTTATLDKATLKDGVTLCSAQVDPATGAVVKILTVLTSPQQYVATLSEDGHNVIIVPTAPLASGTTYVVMLTKDLKDEAGLPLVADTATALTLSDKKIEEGSAFDADTASALESIRQGNQAMIAALKKDDIKTDNIAQLWSFRTQRIGDVQDSLALYATTSTTPQLNLAPIHTVATGDYNITTKDLLTQAGFDTSTFQGNANAYAGVLMGLPQFMPSGKASATDGQFVFSSNTTLPDINNTATIPVVATIPNGNTFTSPFTGPGASCTMPDKGWPVVIYQHGITRNRTDVFGFGETFANACFASVSIDLPLHGLTESNITKNPLKPYERTFNLDLVTQDAQGNITAQDPDGIIDSSGIHYINLAHIATTRDNLHQTTSDLLQLEKALSSIKAPADTTKPLFDTSKIHFYAHSLGTIASAGYINHSVALKSITLAMPGQGLAQLLNNSGSFGQTIKDGLAAQGIVDGTPAYESFMIASQTIVDDADPANYAQAIATNKSAPLLAFEVIGSKVPTIPCSGVAADSDNVIPNCVATAPLSGTEPFLNYMGAQNIDLSKGPLNIDTTPTTVTRFTSGDHSSPLRPDDITVNIHTQLITFILSNGTKVSVSDTSTIYQP